MEDLAMAVAIAVTYIEGRPVGESLDADVSALEDIAAHLQAADPDCKRAVSAALQKIGSEDLIDALGLA